jgi:hypothetical protein
MAVKLNQILTCETVWTLKTKNKRLIQALAFRIQ